MNGKKGTTYFHNFLDANGEVYTFKSPKKFDTPTVFADKFDKLPLVKVSYKLVKGDNNVMEAKLENIEDLK